MKPDDIRAHYRYWAIEVERAKYNFGENSGPHLLAVTMKNVMLELLRRDLIREKYEGMVRE